MTAFAVETLDHVELFVPSRREAAAWYARVLGLTVVEEYRPWADDPRGPLMIATPKGGTKLALFRGRPAEGRETAGFHLVAFRVPGRAFVAFARDVARLELVDHRGTAVTEKEVRDHGQAFSIYFDDPWGHHLELTTYDADEVRGMMTASRR